MIAPAAETASPMVAPRSPARVSTPAPTRRRSTHWWVSHTLPQTRISAKCDPLFNGTSSAHATVDCRAVTVSTRGTTEAAVRYRASPRDVASTSSPLTRLLVHAASTTNSGTPTTANAVCCASRSSGKSVAVLTSTARESSPATPSPATMSSPKSTT